MNYKELLESQRFRDFLPIKNCVKIFRLKGHDNLEGGKMKIVIDASPERMPSITYYDGMNNQIYPPKYIALDYIKDYIKGVSNEFDINEIIIAGPRNYTKKLGEDLKTTFKTVNVTFC